MTPPQISDSLRQRVRQAARDRCGYCLSPQRYVLGTLEVEHLVPRVKGGSNEEDNLWLSCSLCNRYKGAQTSAPDPLTGNIEALKLNNELAVEVRRNWVRAGWHPPEVNG